MFNIVWQQPLILFVTFQKMLIQKDKLYLYKKLHFLYQGSLYASGLMLALSVSLSPLSYQHRSDHLLYGGQSMATELLHIALQDGFINDSVVIRVNGQEVFNKTDIKTRFQIGLADSWEANVNKGKVEVEVILPLKKISKSTILEVSNPTYLGVSLTPEGGIEFRVSKERFLYM